jgi:hypothetical protein
LEGLRRVQLVDKFDTRPAKPEMHFTFEFDPQRKLRDLRRSSKSDSRSAFCQGRYMTKSDDSIPGHLRAAESDCQDASCPAHGRSGQKKAISRRKSKLATLVAIIVGFTAFGGLETTSADSLKLSGAGALHFIGQDATVCGRVASAKYASDANGRPTFLNLDKPYPNQVFTAVIWGENRDLFSYAPESLAGRRICVSGRIEAYLGKAEIKVLRPNQIQT